MAAVDSPDEVGCGSGPLCAIEEDAGASQDS